MVYATGDTHGPLEMRRLNTKNCPAKKGDYVIVLGDFGLCWNNDKEDYSWRKWLSEKPFTTLFIDGNHDNLPAINKLPEVDMFNSTVHRLCPKVFHLKRGHIYIIDGYSFLAFGGALSIDKASRRPYISWWPEEIPSYEDCNKAVDELHKFYNKVDFILAHTCPRELKQDCVDLMDTELSFSDPTEKMLSQIVSIAEFKKFYFGHWHKTVLLRGKYQMVYQDFVRIV